MKYNAYLYFNVARNNKNIKQFKRSCKRYNFILSEIISMDEAINRYVLMKTIDAPYFERADYLCGAYIYSLEFLHKSQCTRKQLIEA